MGGGGGGGGGGGTVYETLPEAVHSAENFFAFIFHFSGWALVAHSRFLHCKFQMYEDCR